MKIYLAAAWGSQEEMRHIREDLRELGHEVTSRWINIPVGEGDGVAQFGTDVAHRHSSMDLEDIDAATAMCLFTKKFSTTGGYFVKFGYALGKGKLVAVIGPLRNIFMGAPRTTHFPDYETFISVVRQDAWDKRAKEKFVREAVRQPPPSFNIQLRGWLRYSCAARSSCS